MPRWTYSNEVLAEKEPTKEICRTVLYFILHRCFASLFAYVSRFLHVYVSRFFACLCFQVGTTTWLEHFLALAELPEKKEKTIQRYLHNRVALFGCLLFVSSVEIQIFMNVFVYLYVFCRNTRNGWHVSGAFTFRGETWRSPSAMAGRGHHLLFNGTFFVSLNFLCLWILLSLIF